MKNIITSIGGTPSSTRLSRIAVVVIGGVLIVGLVGSVGARGWLRARTTHAAQDEAPRTSPIGAELVTLRRFGFEPAEITRPRGSFVLQVDNRAEVEAVDLRLERVGHERTREVHIPHEKLDWIEILPDLPAGEYLLTEANHADWVCRITLTK